MKMILTKLSIKRSGFSWASLLKTGKLTGGNQRPGGVDIVLAAEVARTFMLSPKARISSC